MKPDSDVQTVALVTGGTGFVGAHLIRHLLENGWTVNAVVRPESRLPEALAASPVAWHRHDGSTSGLLAILKVTRPTVVFHLASLFLAQHRPEDLAGLIASNVLFGTQLLEAMDQAGIHLLVNTGTSWQNYENQDYSPVNLYAATKQAFEDIARYYVEARGLRMITLRLFDTYGRDDPRPKLFSLLRRAMATGETLEMSPGEQLIDLVHIDDVVAAFCQAAERLLAGEGEPAQVYAVSSGQPLPLKTVVARCAAIAGGGLQVNWGGRPYRPREVMHSWGCGKRLPGWRPGVDLETGLRSVFATEGERRPAPG